MFGINNILVMNTSIAGLPDAFDDSNPAAENTTVVDKPKTSPFYLFF